MLLTRSELNISNAMETDIKQNKKNNFEILPTGYKVNIEFSDLYYEVPDRQQGIGLLKKFIYKNKNVFYK